MELVLKYCIEKPSVIIIDPINKSTLWSSLEDQGQNSEVVLLKKVCIDSK